MLFVPLRFSCPSPVRCLASSGGGRPFPPVPDSGSCAPWWTGLCVQGGLAPGGWAVFAPSFFGGLVVGPQGPGGRGLLCPDPSLCPPWAGTKAGFFGVAQSMEGLVSILLWFVSVRCRPDAVGGVPLRAGAGLQACRGHCGSGRVTVWARAAYGPSGAPPRVRRPPRGVGPPLARRGAVQGRRPLGRPPVFRGLGRGRGGRGGGVAPGFSVGPLVLLPGGRGGWSEGPRPDPPYRPLCGAARPPPQHARRGLLGVTGCRARPEGLAAGGSVPAVTPAHVPCGRPGGGGAVCVPSSLGGAAGEPRGARGGGSLCLGPSLCLPWAGTKAGFIGVAQSMEGVVSIPVRFVSARCCPDAVRAVPLARWRRTAGLSRSLWEWAGDILGGAVWA